MKTKITEIDFSKFQGGEMRLHIKDASEQEWLRGKIRKLAVRVKAKPTDSEIQSTLKASLTWLVKEYMVTKILSRGPIEVPRYELIAKPYRRYPGEPTMFSKLLTHFMFFHYDMEVEVIGIEAEIDPDGTVRLQSSLGEPCILLPKNHPDILDEELLKNS